MAVSLNIKLMHLLAKNYDGKCLSKVYINAVTPLSWMCKKGHTWDAPYQLIKKGKWCVKCKQKEVYLDEIKQVAISRGGQCLSKEYINNASQLIFMCAEGHRWKTNAGAIKHGTWCRKCFEIRQRDPIEMFQKIAEKLGGKCLSKAYIKKDDKLALKLECAVGHRWVTLSSSIKQGHWCEICRHKGAGIKRRDSLKTYHEIAKKLGGKCLSKEYVHVHAPLRFQCAEGHVWETQAAAVKNSGTWCKICRNKAKGLNKILDSIETFRKIADTNGGKCLSNNYNDLNSILEFECKDKHRWSTKAFIVKYGSWCRKCADRKRVIKKLDSLEN